MTANLNASLGLTCPHGGQFYICKNAETPFFGCCTSDPCVSGDCPAADLRASGFSSGSYSAIAEQSCVGASVSMQWYTCSSAPTFIGCCHSNPCQQNPTCPPEDLGAARLLHGGVSDVFFAPGDGCKLGSSLTAGPISGIAVGSAVIGLILQSILLWSCGCLGRHRKANRWPDMSQRPSSYRHSHKSSGSTVYSGKFGGSKISVHGIIA